MASIRKRIQKRSGKTVYQVQIRMKDRRTVTRSFPKLREAEAWVRSQEREMMERRQLGLPEPEAHTVGELIDRYLRTVMPEKRSGRSQRQQLGWWRERIGDLDVRVVTPALLTQYKEELLWSPGPKGTGRSPATVVRYLAALSHVFTYGVKEWQWMDANPMMKIRKPREPRGRVRFLDEEERRRLLKACRASSHPDLYLVVVIALSTGMRQGELLGLRWGDVDLGTGRAILHETKNGERRAVPILGGALDGLRALALKRGSPGRGALIFPAVSDPTKPMALTRPWRSALKAARIEDFRFHDLRHCAASYLAMSGASLTEIAEILGHKTLAMVKRYAHLSEGHTSSVVARMNDKFLS